MDKLVVYPDNMQKNMDRLGGLHNSQRVLLALTQAGSSREDAYRLVQKSAMKVWLEGANFIEELKGDEEVTKLLTNAEIEDKFDIEYHTKHVETIFARVFKD
jgi:adenylosuccinate lyase